MSPTKSSYEITGRSIKVTPWTMGPVFEENLCFRSLSTHKLLWLQADIWPRMGPWYRLETFFSGKRIIPWAPFKSTGHRVIARKLWIKIKSKHRPRITSNRRQLEVPRVFQAYMTILKACNQFLEQIPIEITYHIIHYFLYKSSFSHVFFTKKASKSLRFSIFPIKQSRISNFRSYRLFSFDCDSVLGVLVNSNESLWIFLV